MTVPQGSDGWRKASRSNQEGACVELAYAGAVRDSKHPTGPVLIVPIGGLLAAVQEERLDR